MDVGEDTTLGDGHMRQELVEFFIVANGELNVAGNDTLTFIFFGSIASQLKKFSDQIFEHSSQVHRGTSADTGSVAAFAQESRQTADRERYLS